MERALSVLWHFYLWDRHPFVMKAYKVKGEGRQSQLSFMLYYDITLMQHVLTQYKKPSSGENRV
jgi:hypothetical protein